MGLKPGGLRLEHHVGCYHALVPACRGHAEVLFGVGKVALGCGEFLKGLLLLLAELGDLQGDHLLGVVKFEGRHGSLGLGLAGLVEGLASVENRD